MPVFNNALAGAAGQSGGAGDYTIERSLGLMTGSSSYLSRTPSSVWQPQNVDLERLGQTN